MIIDDRSPNHNHSEMAPPSVYRYFRPVSIPLYLSGQFPVINVLSHSAELLQFRILSMSVISFCVLELIVGSYFAIKMVMNVKPKFYTIVIRSHYTFKFLTLLWTKLNTKLIIQSLQELDKLSQCSSLIPYQITTPKTQYYLWIAYGIFFVLPLTALLYTFILFYHAYNLHEYIFNYAYSYYNTYSHFRMMVLLSLMLYFCSLSVGDLINIWEVYVSGFLNSPKSLRDFMTLMEKEKVTIRKITTLLGGHFLIIIVELVERLVVGVGVEAMNDEAMLLNIINLFESLIMFWFMVSTIGLTSSKFQELSYDVFTTELNKQDLTRRDAARIKTILVQLEDNPGEVNTAGYGSIDRSVFMWYLCLSIEFLILLWQNKELIREFAFKMG